MALLETAVVVANNGVVELGGGLSFLGMAAATDQDFAAGYYKNFTSKYSTRFETEEGQLFAKKFLTAYYRMGLKIVEGLVMM